MIFGWFIVLKGFEDWLCCMIALLLLQTWQTENMKRKTCCGPRKIRTYQMLAVDGWFKMLSVPGFQLKHPAIAMATLGENVHLKLKQHLTFAPEYPTSSLIDYKILKG